MSKFVILLAGSLVPTERLQKQIAGARFIAADQGMAHAATLGLIPELWLGDFDSASAALQQQFASVPRETFPAAKAATDGELAIAEALRRGATELILLGGLGGQLDHVLAHMTKLVTLAQQNVKAFATSGAEEAWPLVEKLSFEHLQPAIRLSIVGLSNLDGLSMTGVRWPLKDHHVPMGSTLTLSNETTGTVHMSLKAGVAVVVIYPTGAMHATDN